MPDAAWVAAGEGVATRKWDGQAVLVQDGAVFKRYDAKKGRTPPEDFVPAQPSADPVSGHWPGWVPVTANDRPILLSVAWGKEHLFGGANIPDGTYEAVGPLIGTRHGPNPENLPEQRLVIHAADELHDAPRDYDGLIEYLRDREIEGIVWHHPDGRKAKIKKHDFPGRLMNRDEFDGGDPILAANLKDFAVFLFKDKMDRIHGKKMEAAESVRRNVVICLESLKGIIQSADPAWLAENEDELLKAAFFGDLSRMIEGYLQDKKRSDA